MFTTQKNKSLTLINYYPTKKKSIHVDCVLNIINSDVICLESIDVYPTNKTGHGYGSDLLKYIINYCEQLGYNSIVLNVLDDQVYLINWYQQHGFVISSELIENRVFLMKKLIGVCQLMI